MDFVAAFHQEVTAFESALRRAVAEGAAPPVPTCPGWSVADLAAHLGGVHRGVAAVIAGGRATWPDPSADPGFLGLPDDLDGWPAPEHAPNLGPVPAGFADWFAQGAAELESLFAAHDPGDPAWTWSREQNVGFWLRMQTIEAAVHRWDAEHAFGAAAPIEPALARDAIGQTFEVMAPARRAWRQAPPGAGERYWWREKDGPGAWTVRFDGDEVSLTTGPGDVEVAGPASDLMLFLWGRVPADRLDVTGERDLLDRYFTLVPPV
ncbi:maleylpyruvate isomerase family mycothiol-dependent enzyme [Nonomuraea sp. NN258]|uniref:maleylpyruvate isomerase family mycothiol-dependent enzyme n=1 Tax=Nonomuraea antri TaxID=2730852 RepID=UPI00156916F7|nr:maleylpyruvate isomerase family mycothiol-dependent enzyme [Nonomuraea antri]NRQ39243.1 maleylpyruvate isomerase family mycothiol-dependent enzyme [Nonomuraea antri]